MVDPTWVLALMLRAEPMAASSPWRGTYETTARAIADAANANPIRFGGDADEERTAAFIVSVAFYESHFQPNAEGDRPKRADGTLGPARSLCAMQVGASNLKGLGVTREGMLDDITTCIDTGLRMMHTSFGVCRGLPLEKRLVHYAAGGNGCALANADAVKKSKHRVDTALALFKAIPPPATPTRVGVR